MSDLEGMINGILSNPDEMKKIMDMAGKIMGSQSGASASQSDSGTPQGSALDGILSGINAPTGDIAAAAQNLMGGGGLQSLLGGGGLQKLLVSPTVQRLLSSRTLRGIMSSKAVQSLASGGINTKNDKSELFDALKPYLSAERRAKLERAMVFAKAMRFAGVAGAAALKK
ncbi:MAG: hypothetical protein EOM51_08215 [Clostridia bacterium]|nr:hypothetical protein [Clostridia bacterium]